MILVKYWNIFFILGLSLFLVDAKKKHKKHHDGTDVPPVNPAPLPVNENFCQNFIKDKTCTWTAGKTITINGTSPCIFQCQYNPSKDLPVRLNVHVKNANPFGTNVFISARQNHFESSWTLPITFSEHGTNQPFTTIEEMLCPPLKEQTENLFFRIETVNEAAIVNVSLSRPQYQLRLNETVTVVSSPVSPWIKNYQWEDNQESVLVSVDSASKSGRKVCTLLSLQNGKCPVFTDKKGIMGAGSGRYQTFQEKGGMVAKKSLFPDGLHIIILPLPDDSLCSGLDIDFDNRTSRIKSTRLQVLAHKSIDQVSGIFIGVFIALSLFVLGSTVGIIHLGVKRNLGKLLESADSDLEFLVEDNGPRMTVEAGVLFTGNRNNAQVEGLENEDPLLSGNNGSDDPLLGVREHLANVIPDLQFQSAHNPIRDQLLAIGQGSVGNTPRAGYNPMAISSNPNNLQSTLEPTDDFNPSTVYWWKFSREHTNLSKDALVSETGFHNNMILIAAFIALPYTEIIRSYFHVFYNNGSEDQCYFNTRCIVSAGIFPDFSRVFSNVVYLEAAIAFWYIMKRHRQFNWIASKGETLGVSRNYKLFLAIAIGLGIQFFMSGLYHTCPNVVTLRFDLMFMYVNAIVLIIGIWGLRHDSVAPHVYPTVAMIGGALFFAELKDFISATFFWIILACIQAFFTFTITLMMYKTSQWSFSPMEMIKIWKKWSPILRKMRQDVLQEHTTAVSPWTIIRMIIGIVANFILCTIGFYMDMEIYFYILLVCIINMACYTMNYIFTKRVLNNEKGTLVSWICLSLSFIFGLTGLVFFSFSNTNSEYTASASRALNSECILFGVFDSHDIWHMTSALGLFFLCTGILTLDDDLASTHPKNFASF